MARIDRQLLKLALALFAIARRGDLLLDQGDGGMSEPDNSVKCPKCGNDRFLGGRLALANDCLASDGLILSCRASIGSAYGDVRCFKCGEKCTHLWEVTMQGWRPKGPSKDD